MWWDWSPPQPEAAYAKQVTDEASMMQQNWPQPQPADEASMMWQWPPPQPEAAYADAEQLAGHFVFFGPHALAEQPEEFRSVAGKLLRLSSAGIEEVDKATASAQTCGRLWQLAAVKQAFQYVSECAKQGLLHKPFLVPGGRCLERCAAQALLQVNELIRRQAAQREPLPAAAVKSLKILEILSRDILVLACSRFVSQTRLRSKGMPEELALRFKAALGDAVWDELKDVLGNSKFQVFPPDPCDKDMKHPGGRRRKGKPRNVRERDAARLLTASAPADSSTVPEDEADVVSLMQADGDEALCRTREDSVEKVVAALREAWMEDFGLVGAVGDEALCRTREDSVEKIVAALREAWMEDFGLVGAVGGQARVTKAQRAAEVQEL